jgi:phosphogluconate dehydratase
LSPSLHPVVGEVTRQVQARSAGRRAAYLAQVDALSQRKVHRARLSCSNQAHAYAAADAKAKLWLAEETRPNIGIVSAYNDMLSAHQPYEGYPERIRQAALRLGATAQVAGGVPAMCDGVTQGRAGMELSLFSRDVIAQATAIALSHDAFDAALCLGICDKIVPGLLIGALAFGHLPVIFVPAGPMGSGLANKQKAAVRERYAQGKATRQELLAAESAAYHGAGTCTFYGTANSNQMLLEAMGLHLPGAAFVHPGTPLRDALTDAAVARVLQLTAASADYTPIGKLVDERCIVNALVALLATGGSTNHTMHWVAVARAAGIVVKWEDFDRLSAVVPLLARVYPNGSADVNAFEEAGGPSLVTRELLSAGLMHADVLTVAGQGLARYGQRPRLSDATLTWQDVTATGDASVLRSAREPFAATGGLRVLNGNLGRSIIKVSAVPEAAWTLRAPAIVFDSQDAVEAAFRAGELNRDFFAVVRFQGPRANGMPELHKLTPALSSLMNAGHRVGLITDGRMSGASGKVPAALHLTPEASLGGPLAKLRTGDVIELDAGAGVLQVLVDASEWAHRTPAAPPARDENTIGRSLFAGARRSVGPADRGACTLFDDAEVAEVAA